jgi:large subunit ribosomal protein L3
MKGQRMGGHMGDKQFTSQNLEIVRIDTEKNLLAVKGSVPGSKGALVAVQGAAKS